MNVLLSDPAGSKLTTAQAALTRESGRTYYSVEIPGDTVRKTAASGGGMAIAFQRDGAGVSTSLSLPGGSAFPEVVHASRTAAELPKVRILSARALVRAGELVLSAVVSYSGERPVAGTIRWRPAGQGTDGPSGPLELEGRSRTQSTLTFKPADPATLNPIWMVSWEDSDRAVPRAAQRVRLMRPLRELLGGARLPRTVGRPAPAKAAREDSLVDLPLSLRKGQYLEVQLHYDGPAADEAVHDLTSRWIDGNGSRKSLGLAMREARLSRTPEGGLWATATWLVPSDRDVPGLVLRAPRPAPLPHAWTLDYLGLLELYTPAGTY